MATLEQRITSLAEAVRNKINLVSARIDGIGGSSAYDIWLSLNNTGSETDFINSLKGSNGINGINGEKGEPGLNGTSIPRTMQCYEDLLEGMYVNIFIDNGVPKLRKTNAALGYLADGYVLSNFSAGSNALFFMTGDNTKTNTCAVGEIYLSATTPGRATNDKPAERSGFWLQKIGTYLGNNSAIFDKGIAIQMT